jgi:predicted O-methyltransferase YrrM
VEHVKRFFPDLQPETIRNRLFYSTFVNTDRRYMYFEVPKSGCSSMKTLIHSLEELPPMPLFAGGFHEVRREMFIHDRGSFKLKSLVDFDNDTQEWIMTSPEFFRFTVIRNPYSRLESAWRDKVRLCAPGFERFYYALRGGIPKSANACSLITFPEFVSVIAKEDLRICDHHWRLQTAHLFYPAFEFSHIGRIEEFDRTVDLLIERGKFAKPPKSEMVNRTQSISSYDEKLASDVHALYEADFEAFNYSEASWDRPPQSQTETDILKSIPESKYLDDVFERNVLLGSLYKERDRLVRVSTVKSDGFLAQYSGLSFDELYAQYINPIDGWLDRAEAAYLFNLARNVATGCIVEVGSYRGRSTVALALGSLAGARAPVFAVDPHEAFTGEFGGKFGPVDRGHFMSQMVALGLFHIVRLVNLGTESLSNNWPMPVSLLWIDGDHRYESVARDFAAWRPRLSEDAIVVLDDVGPDTGPGKLLRDLVDNETVQLTSRIGKIASMRARKDGQTS